MNDTTPKRARSPGCYPRGKKPPGKKPQNKWWLVIDEPRESGGRRKRRWHKFAGTKRQAEAKRAKLLAAIEDGSYVEPSRETVGAYLERWLMHIESHVAKKTFERYAQIARTHLAPAFGSKKLSKLNAPEIDGAYARWQNQGRVRGVGGLSARSVLHHHRVLHKALAQALKWKLVTRNVADAAEPPSPTRHEIRALNETEAAQLLHFADGTRLAAPIYVLLTTGVRRGELLGLKWSDVDFDAAMLSVRRSVEQTKAGVGFKLPKSGNARAIELAKGTLNVLRKHRATQNADRLLFGAHYKNDDLIFAREDGTIWKPDTLSKAFEELVKRANIGHVRLHDLRHACASLLLKSGVHAKIVSERLGHSTVGITLDLYSHVLPGLQQAAADKLDHLLDNAISVGALGK